MSWVNAAPIVAAMADEQALWNLSEGERVGIAVCRPCPFSYVWREVKHAVALARQLRGPIPALAGSIHLRPEPRNSVDVRLTRVVTLDVPAMISNFETTVCALDRSRGLTATAFAEVH